MESRKKRAMGFCRRLLKYLLTPVSRVRKFSRKLNMRQFKIAVGLLGISSCFITLLLYYWHRSPLTENRSSTARPKVIVGTPFMHVRLDEIYKDKQNQDSDDSLETDETKQALMIDTPGCQIPVSMINYREIVKKGKRHGNCGRRAVFLKKIFADKVQATIKPKNIKKYLRKSAHFDCCYRFLRRSTRLGHENKKIQYSSCQKFNDGAVITLETDFINIKCFEYDRRNNSYVIYDDVYGFTIKLNITKKLQPCKKRQYNVMIIGMDSMSLPRLVQTMPRTVAYFKDNFWLGYRGYTKVEDNTFPNLMAAFTGKNLTTLSTLCSGKMDKCNDILIWNTFKTAGYVTAYAEDYLRLPDTFSRKYVFQNPPTDHYMRPFFLKGETELFNKSLVCAGKASSGEQILDYAFDFANTYRAQSFFGVFWVNSFSHNINSRPQDSDKIFENFFNRLYYTGVFENTFVIFFSDHGLRFGENRLQMSAYYDDRMPFLFFWAPFAFKRRQANEFKSMAINQFRLLTPYDIFNTLIEISSWSRCMNFSGSVSEGCPNCQSIFNSVSENRTCNDIAIPEKWCSCHKLYPLDTQDSEGLKSVYHVISYIKSMIKSIKTKYCWGCMDLKLKNVIRIHFYYNNHKTKLYHVVAFVMSPGNVAYEATVLRKADEIELIGSVSVISPYRGLGKCTMQYTDRLFCVCQKIENCRNS